MADIVVSSTKQDQPWAVWIGQAQKSLGHVPRIHEWEISAGGDIAAWMQDRHHNADHVLCVVSEISLTKPYSRWERLAAQWATAGGQHNFTLPVFVEDCMGPNLFAHLKRCDLFDFSEAEAMVCLEAFLKPAQKPSGPVAFPGAAPKPVSVAAPEAKIDFPGTLSNIPIRVPRHCFGRNAALARIEAAMATPAGAITALHGLRGVGKTTLAAAFAERHKAAYRATWWIRAAPAWPGCANAPPSCAARHPAIAFVAEPRI